MTGRLGGGRGRTRLGRWSTVLVVGLLLSALAACSPDKPTAEPARPMGVDLTADVPDQLSIGVLVSLAATPGEGAEWRDAAQGSVVAAHRFQTGGAQVTLVPANDKGTAKGTTAAVSTLVSRGVSGIVIATSGDHVTAAVAAAAKAGVPVMLPYAEAVDDLPAGAWLTGPTTPSVDARLAAALSDRGVKKPFLVNAGGGSIEGLSPSGTRAFHAGGDAGALAKALKARRKKPRTTFDAVAVSGPAALQAKVVQALQGADVDVPLVLTPQALSPAFAPALTDAGGSLSGQFISAGLNNGDAAALDSSAAGRALAAYFSGLRLTVDDPAAKDLLAERPFGEVAGAADVRSHDAVVALVRAAAAAHATDPAKVAQALSGLRLGAGDGLAGPALDFSAAAAVSDDAVVALGATSESPRLRPTTTAGSPALYWFPMPAS